MEENVADSSLRSAVLGALAKPKPKDPVKEAKLAPGKDWLETILENRAADNDSKKVSDADRKKLLSTINLNQIKNWRL